MTKDDVETVVKRYKYVAQAIKNQTTCAKFYIGNRKFTIEITDAVTEVCKIINDVRSKIRDDWLKRLIDGVLAGKNDASIIMFLPWQRNAFYKRKKEFYNTVYMCCAARNLISYDEILADVA